MKNPKCSQHLGFFMVAKHWNHNTFTCQIQYSIYIFELQDSLYDKFPRKICHTNIRQLPVYMFRRIP